MIEIDPKIEEKVILVGICPQGQSIEKIEEYLDELAFLAETAGGITVKSFATSKIATVSIASGTPALQLPGSVHEVPAFPVQEV